MRAMYSIKKIMYLDIYSIQLFENNLLNTKCFRISTDKYEKTAFFMKLQSKIKLTAKLNLSYNVYCLAQGHAKFSVPVMEPHLKMYIFLNISKSFVQSLNEDQKKKLLIYLLIDVCLISKLSIPNLSEEQEKQVIVLIKCRLYSKFMICYAKIE